MAVEKSWDSYVSWIIECFFIWIKKVAVCIVCTEGISDLKGLGTEERNITAGIQSRLRNRVNGLDEQQSLF
jgi:hypothetical protein